MPPKLQVDESFAFLFTCIEASGCKVDFKLVGDATDLQPAAARMRYTRLRKAVEAGHFKGATLVQPNLIAASLSQLANPHSRRTGNNAISDEEQQRRRSNSLDDGPKSPLRTRSSKTIDIDEEEEEDEEGDEDEELIEGLEHLRRRRRRCSLSEKAMTSDNDLFFPDTSRSTRARKRIKHSDGDIDEEVRQGNTKARLDHGSERTAQRPPSSQEPLQPGTYQQVTHPWNSPYNAHDGQHQGMLVSASDTAYQFPQKYNDPHQSTQISRKKRSANAAAQAAYNIGIGLGKWGPHPGDDSGQVQPSTYLPAPNYAQRLAYTGTGIHPPSTNTFWYDGRLSGNPNSLHDQHPQHNRSMYSYQANEQGAYHYSTYADLPTSSLAMQPVSTTGTGNTPHLDHTSAHHSAVANPEVRPQTPRVAPQHKSSGLNRFHPASVFDGFHAPTMLSHTPISRTGSGVQQNGEVSLLHKVMMEREKDNQPMEKQTRQPGQAPNKKAAVVDNTRHTKKAARNDRERHENEAIHNIDTDGPIDDSNDKHTNRVQPPNHRATSTDTAVVDPGNANEKR